MWREDLNPRIEVVRKLAAEYSALLIPLDGRFAAACVTAEPAFWAADGVHPTLAGYGLIANVARNLQSVGLDKMDGQSYS